MDFVVKSCKRHGSFAAPVCPRCSDSGQTQPAPEQPQDVDSEPPDAFTGAEKLLHRDFATDMQRRGCHVIHCRTDMVSTIACGLPDVHVLFTGADGITRAAAIEFKKAGGVLSDKQRKKIAEMRAKGIPVKVAFTLKDAINFCKESLRIPPEV